MATTVESLRSRFKLTPCEAKLVMRLTHGDCLRTAAEALGITYQTARTLLKTVFLKTNTHRQAELIIVVLNDHDTDRDEFAVAANLPFEGTQ
jgi:DNA-binding CsgD family transcriptional regulator